MSLNIFSIVAADAGPMEAEFPSEIRGWKNKYIFTAKTDLGCITNYFIWPLELRKENSDKYVTQLSLTRLLPVKPSRTIIIVHIL